MQEKAKKSGIFLIGIVISLCIIVQWWMGFEQSVVEQTLSRLAYPLLVVHNNTVEPIRQFFVRWHTKSDLFKKIEILEQERDNAREEVITLSAQLAFVQETSTVAEFKQWYDATHVVLVQVLLKNISDQEHFFLVDEGSNQNIKKNMVAMYKNNIIGRVTEVYPSYSKVVLVSDRTCNVAVYCSKSRATGIYEGVNSKDQGSVTHVSHLQPVTVGELIISSGDGMIFPQGFALGIITAVACDGLVHTITTQPLCDISAIRYCYLVQKGTT